MSNGGGCLIIVPREQLELAGRLTTRFLAQSNIRVRLDARSGDRESTELEVFAIGGGPLDPQLRAYVEEEIRQCEASA